MSPHVVGTLRFSASLSSAHYFLSSLIHISILEVLWLFLATEVVLAQGALAYKS